MKKNLSFLALIFFTMTAYGIGSSVQSNLSTDLAASIGLSKDEIAQINVGFIISQILAFNLASLMIRQYNTTKILFSALILCFISNLMFCTHIHNIWLFTVNWFIYGFASSLLLVSILVLILHRFTGNWLPVILAFALFQSTLLPLGIYGWLFTYILESHQLYVFFIALSALLACALIMMTLFTPAAITIDQKPKSGWLTYSFISITLSLFAFVFMRGSYYNWLNSVFFSKIVIVTLLFALATIYFLHKEKQRHTTASMLLHNQLKVNIYIYNAFLIGFIITSSNMLFNNFLTHVLGYNALTVGDIHIFSFYTMVVGMCISVFLICYKRSLIDPLVPMGIVMLLIAIYKFSYLTSAASPNQLISPMLLRGVTIGLLNIAISISVLTHYKKEQQLEGTCNFYLFRTLGVVTSNAFFAKIIQNKSAQASSEIGESLNGLTQNYTTYKQMLDNAILTYGHQPFTSVSLNQINGTVSTQATTLALNNSLTILIFAILILVPILLVSKKFAAKREKQRMIENQS